MSTDSLVKQVQQNMHLRIFVINENTKLTITKLTIIPIIAKIHAQAI